MKVCLLGSKGNFDTRIGKGTQRYAYELSKYLCNDKRIEATKQELGFWDSDRLNKVSFTLSVPFTPLWDYDIIHMPAPIMFSPPLRGDAKIVTTATEFMQTADDAPIKIAEREYQSIHGKPEFSDIREFITFSCINQALSSDYLLVTCDQIKKEAIIKGFNKDKIFVTNLGIDERFSQPIHKKSGKKFIVGFLGALNLRKNVKFAIEAFKRVKGDNIEFHIWGRGGMLEALKEQAKDDKRIKFMGFAPEDKLVEVYDSFDVFLYPILYTGLEFEIMEAKTRGLPVIVYKYATMSDENRIYCLEAEDPKDAASMIEDLKKSKVEKPYNTAAMKHARGFTWKKCADDTIKAYKKCV